MLEKHIRVPRARFNTVEEGRVKIAAPNFDVFIPGEIEQYVSSLSPDPRFRYEQSLIMSAGDRYGSNLNGDVFTADELLGTQSANEAAKNPGAARGVQMPRYKTFEMAKFFRHHDNRPSSPYYGDFPCVAWNDPMCRVEFIIRIAKENVPELGMTGAPDIILKLDRDGKIDLSMGASIAFERCTVCGNENEFVKDRCTHLKHQMNDILPDGRLVCAHNFGSRFFDGSYVTIPADPIATSLVKVASAKTRGMKGQRNEVIDDPAGGGSEAQWRSKAARIRKNVPVELGVYRGPESTIPADRLAAAIKAGGHDLDTVLSTATLAGVVLTPTELGYLTYGCQRKAADFPGVEAVRLDKFSTAVYNALAPWEDRLSGFLPTARAVPEDIVKLASEGYGEMAAYYGWYRASLRSFSPTAYIKSASKYAGVQRTDQAEFENRARVAWDYLQRCHVVG